MRRFVLYIIVIGSFSTGMLKGQSTEDNPSEVLEKLFGRLSEIYDDTVRMRINDSIRVIVESYAGSDSIFVHRFGNLKYLGQITSPDSLIKIVTWNLILTSHPGRYFCYFIRKGEHGKGNSVYSLTSGYREESVSTDTIYTMSDWYGALYYDLKPCIIDDKNCWILLGIDYGNPEVSRKIIDVLSFTSDNSILFGRKWFLSGDQLRFRAVFEYASNGMMTLRFTSGSSIVFDHLVPFNMSHKDDHQFYGPDYSYDAYNLENGIWKLSINVDARNKE
jgi:hypothetical protein